MPVTHQDLWRAIDQIAKQHRISVSMVAQRAGLDPTSFNVSKRSKDGRPRWPSTESISKVLVALNMSFRDLVDILEADDEPKRLARPKQLIIDLAALMYPPFPALRHFDEVGRLLHGRVSYVLRITNRSLAPMYNEGDALMVSTPSALNPGDRALLVKNNGELILGLVQSAGPVAINLNNNEGSKSIERTNLKLYHKIDWLKQ